MYRVSDVITEVTTEKLEGGAFAVDSCRMSYLLLIDDLE